MSTTKITPKKNTRPLGLDMGSYYLKLVELEYKKAGTWEVANVGLKDIHAGTDTSFVLKQLLAETGVKGKEVTISLSGENVVARYLSLPRMGEDELKKAITFELEGNIPFKPEEVYFDQRILGDDPKVKNKIRVFLVAAKKDFVDRAIEVVRRAGLQPGIITMDALALRNTFCHGYAALNQNAVTILNIGHKITNLLILQDTTPYFVRDTYFGAETITNVLQTKLGLEKKAAEDLLCNLPQAPEDAKKLVKTTLASLLNEIFVALDFFENLTGQKCNTLYLSGGTSQLFELKEFFRSYLDLEITMLDPCKNLSFAPKLLSRNVTQLCPYLSVALGLALEEK